MVGMKNMEIEEMWLPHISLSLWPSFPIIGNRSDQILKRSISVYTKVLLYSPFLFFVSCSLLLITQSSIREWWKMGLIHLTNQRYPSSLPAYFLFSEMLSNLHIYILLLLWSWSSLLLVVKTLERRIQYIYFSS